MLDHNLIKELHKQGHGYSEIARQFNVSRQRIYALVNNYRNTGRANREYKYRDFGLCNECNKEQSVALHHKDFNNENDDTSNLQALCHKCHVKKHLKEIDPVLKAKVTERYKTVSFNTIQKEFNISPGMIRKILDEAKKKGVYEWYKPMKPLKPLESWKGNKD